MAAMEAGLGQKPKRGSMRLKLFRRTNPTAGV
jgi:hypothetical protein